MECPKCKSNNILKLKANRIFNINGKGRIQKRYYCVDCNTNFDFV